MRTYSAIAATHATALLLCLTTACAADTVHLVTIGAHEDVRLTLPEVDKNIAEVNRILAQKNFPTDYPCPSVRLVRSGNLDKLPSNLSLPGTINSSDEFNEYAASPYTVNVVSSINWCGGGRNDINQVYVGCARRGTGPLLVERIHLSEGALWAHEFAHTQGLSWATDRSGHTQRPKALMLPTLSKRNKGLTQAECATLANDSRIANSSQSPAATAGHEAQGRVLSGDDHAPATNQSSQQSGERSALEDLLTEVWMHGLPYSKLAKLSESQVSRVREILTSPPAESWPNAVLVLGVRGNEEDFSLLRRVVDYRGGKAFSLILATAKHNVPIAVGYLAGRTGNKEMVRFLRENYNPNRAVKHFDGPIRFAVADAQKFAVSSAIGLAYSGANAETRLMQQTALKNLESSVERGAFLLDVNPTFFKSLHQISAAVNELGIERYLAKSTGFVVP